MEKEFGWVGTPYKSNFRTSKKTIELTDVVDLSDLTDWNDVLSAARASGCEYFISPKPSKRQNRLYKLSGSSAKCVVAMEEYARKNNQKWKDLYHHDLQNRVRQLVASARTRAKNGGKPFDLDLNDIYARVSAGRCEATGMVLNLTDVGHAFGPSLDQISPGAGYTQENTQIVCSIFNRMKADYGPDEVKSFFDHIRSHERGCV